MKNVSLYVKYNTESSSIVYSVNEDRPLSLSGYKMICPLGHRANSFSDGKSYFTSFCIPCRRGMYNLSRGEEYSTEHGKNSFRILRNNIQCSACVRGGTCDSTIRSVGNNWGFANLTGHVTFTPCPVNYCCSPTGAECESYDTCAKHRTGRLCGICEKGYSLNFLSTDCVGDENCSDSSLVGYMCAQCLTAVAYVLVLLWLKEIVLYVKQCVTIDRMKPQNGMDDIVLRPRTKSSMSISKWHEVCSEESTNNLKDDEECGGKRKTLISGLIKIVFFFYQTEPLLRVHAPVKATYTTSSWILRTLISSIFNIKLNGNGNGFVFCPFVGLTTVQKNLMKVSFVFTMLFVLLLFYWLNRLVVVCRRKFFEEEVKYRRLADQQTFR